MSIIHHSVKQSVDYKIGGQSVQFPTQVLEDQLTLEIRDLYQPEGQIVPPHYYLPTHITTCPPSFR